MTLRIAIYARISRDREGTEVGVSNQKTACEDIARELGGVVMQVYTDNDAGASKRSKAKRPNFAQMLKDAEAGKLDVIVAYSMSRLTRRAAEWVQLIDLAEKKKIQFRFKVSPSFDLRTADGRASAMTIAIWDGAEAERTGERIQFARQSALAQGKDMRGVRPFGYEPGCTEFRQEEAEALRWAYQTVIDGGSLLSVAREFTARGLKRDRATDCSWRPQSIRHMLLRERNRGHLVVKGTLYSTDLLAIVDSDTWEAAKAVLTDPARKPKRGRQPIRQSVTGLIKCGVCGSYVRLASSRGQMYLKCAKDGRPIHTQNLKHPTMLLPAVEAEVSRLIQQRLTALIVTDTDFSTTKPTKGIQLELAEVRRQRDLAQDMIFEPGANVPALKAKVAALGMDIDRLQVEFDQAVSADIGGSAIDAAMTLVRAQHGSGDDWSAYWQGLDVDEQRALIKALLPNARLLRATQERRVIADELPSLIEYAPAVIGEKFAGKWMSFQLESLAS